MDTNVDVNIEVNDDYFMTITCARENRNQLLAKRDRYILADYPITESNLILVKEYRQALRDYMNLPEVLNYNSSNNIPLPPFPAFPF
jgi:hypothetical protein